MPERNGEVLGDGPVPVTSLPKPEPEKVPECALDEHDYDGPDR